MEKSYSISEILNAVDELHNLKKDKKITKTNPIKKDTSEKNDIPKDTLKLIEDAEKIIKSNLKSE
tara:strand:- start:62 stop:256 length:195 start_codon:yes stop_codon:yes gene_type:complete